ncbi:MAG: succinate dehydrogenase cytochrome b subunit [Planctomycetaceae bacterium]
MIDSLCPSNEEPTLSWLTAALRSSVGKKFVMGGTGLFLCLFLVMHLAGNLLLFAGANVYNEYAHKLHSMGGLLVLAEVILFAAFGAHIYLAFVTSRENRIARQRSYEIKQSKKEAGNIISGLAAENTMFVSGAIILLYLILHLADFKFGLTGADAVASPYDKARLLLGETWRAIAYAAASLIVGYHVSHGFASAFQSLGISHPKYTSWIKTAAVLFAIAVAVGYLLVVLVGHSGLRDAVADAAVPAGQSAPVTSPGH